MPVTARITIAGLGAGAPGDLTLGAWEALKSSPCTLLRTGKHPVVEWLCREEIAFSTFDAIYEQAPNFQEVYARIAEAVLGEARRQPVLYAVPGHPLVAEESVRLILERAEQEGLQVKLLPAVSFLDAVFSALRLVASDVKLSLLELYPPEHPVTVLRAAGVPGEERVETHPLFEIDRLDWVDHLTSLYLPETDKSNGICCYPLDPLVKIISRLRGENGCPWDREQDHRTLRPYLLEEAYEVLEALNEGDMYKVCEELGDLLLQVVFHAQIASESRSFDINDVVAGISEKLTRRHPHVFGSVTVRDSREVNLNWAKIKAEEKGGYTPKGLLADVSMSVPALMRAFRLQKKAAGVGFDWPDYSGAMDKVHEELDELESVAAGGELIKIEEELGDLLFSVVNLARLLGVEPETALTGTSTKFIKRFAHVEEMARLANRDLLQCTLAELDKWWEEAKKLEKIREKR